MRLPHKSARDWPPAMRLRIVPDKLAHGLIVISGRKQRLLESL
jgi:hypothetical protein